MKRYYVLLAGALLPVLGTLLSVTVAPIRRAGATGDHRITVEAVPSRFAAGKDEPFTQSFLIRNNPAAGGVGVQAQTHILTFGGDPPTAASSNPSSSPPRMG